jgi:hypothetical protein
MRVTMVAAAVFHLEQKREAVLEASAVNDRVDGFIQE